MSDILKMLARKKLQEDLADHANESAYRPHTPKASKSLTELKKVHLRDYSTDILIYHFRASHHAYSSFKASLDPKLNGFVQRLRGEDRLSSFPVQDGDEVPAHNLEVAYLSKAFTVGTRKVGSALGFRTKRDCIDWFAFDRDISGLLANHSMDPFADAGVGVDVKVLFDHVATLPKGIERRGIVGTHPEFRAWFDSLRDAVPVGAEKENDEPQKRKKHEQLCIPLDPSRL
ncbi:hypothetical protein IQ07DRAFT_635346 [Pyrenochaeta sp. DS3sAY3a]|nr:hypothetical protein IQ07DRAFT_635346 [Pyrenochaeta sp. DS3sAY3a]